MKWLIKAVSVKTLSTWVCALTHYIRRFKALVLWENQKTDAWGENTHLLKNCVKYKGLAVSLTSVMSLEAAAALMWRLGWRMELLQSRARAKVPTALTWGGQKDTTFTGGYKIPKQAFWIGSKASIQVNLTSLMTHLIHSLKTTASLTNHIN